MKITETETRVVRDGGMERSNGCSCLSGPELLSYKPGTVMLFTGGDALEHLSALILLKRKLKTCLRCIPSKQTLQKCRKDAEV